MKFNDHYFLESINDKNLFKAIFLAGGPGSGKSFISNLAFKGEPVSFVNQDIFTEMIFKKENLSLVFDSSKKELYAQQQQTREKARNLISQRMYSLINGMIPLVIDGTGRKFDKIKDTSDVLREIGYDTYMIFVNTSLDVAKKRNEKRERKVDDQILVDAWHQVQDNIGKFQDLFGKENFMVVDNSKELTPEEIKELELKLTRSARKFLNDPLKNPIGRSILINMKKVGAQNLLDLSDELVKNKQRISV